MVSFLKGIFFSSKEPNKKDTFLFKIYLNLSRTSFIKVNFHENQYAKDVLLTNQDEIIRIFNKQQNLIINKNENFLEKWCFCIINTANEYIRVLINHDSLIKDYVLLTKQDKNYKIILITRQTFRKSNQNSIKQGDSFEIFEEKMKKNTKREGELSLFVNQSNDFENKNIYMDGVRVYVYDKKSKELIIINIIDIKSIRLYTSTDDSRKAMLFSLKQVNSSLNSKTNQEKVIKTRKFLLEILTKDDEFYFLSSKNENDLINWHSILYIHMKLEKEKEEFTKYGLLINETLFKIYKKEIILLTENFSRQGFLSFYFQLKEESFENKFNYILNSNDICNSNIKKENDFYKNTDENIGFNSVLTNKDHFELIKIFFKFTFPLLKSIFNFKSFVLNKKHDLAYEELSKILNFLENSNDFSSDEVRISEIFNEATLIIDSQIDEKSREYDINIDDNLLKSIENDEKGKITLNNSEINENYTSKFKSSKNLIKNDKQMTPKMTMSMMATKNVKSSTSIGKLSKHISNDTSLFSKEEKRKIILKNLIFTIKTYNEKRLSKLKPSLVDWLLNFLVNESCSYKSFLFYFSKKQFFYLNQFVFIDLHKDFLIRNNIKCDYLVFPLGNEIID